MWFLFANLSTVDTANKYDFIYLNFSLIIIIIVETGALTYLPRTWSAFCSPRSSFFCKYLWNITEQSL